MKSLLRAFQAELIKSNRTYGLLISILIPILITGLQFLIFFIKHEYFARFGFNPWKIMGDNLFNSMGLIVLPLYLILIAYLINFTEHRSGAWKYLFSLPIPKFSIYTAKILLTFLWLLIFCVLTALLFFGSGWLLIKLRPDIGFQDYNINTLIIISFIKLYLSCAGILAIQFFLSIYWKDFIRPVGIGIACVIVALILGSWKMIFIFPYSNPKLVSSSLAAQDTDIFIDSVIISIIFSVIFFIGGYFLLAKQEVK